LSIFVLSTALPSCARRPVAPKVTTPIPLEEAERILHDLRREEKSVVRYQAILKIRGKGPEGRFTATQVLIFERPDRVRVELLGAFGSTRWIAVASGGEILVWFPSRREFLRDSRVEEVVGALLGVPLSPEEVMAVLAGVGLPFRGSRPSGAVREDGARRIELAGAQIELDGMQVRWARGDGYRVAYPTPWKARGKQVPDRVDIEASELQASINVEDLDVNVLLHPEAFVLELPQDAQRLELHQIEGEAVFVKTNP
jgi:hypothetical protein